MPDLPNAVLVGPAAFRVMPWKNGGGATTELLIDPPGASLETGFRWRLSMAAVPASGPFSRFPGVDRSLLLLDGPGLELSHAGHGGCRLLPLGEPARFSGDWDTQGTLLGGPCRDFNVMSDRARVRHTLTVLRPEAGAALTLPAAGTLLLYCHQGRAELAGQVLEAGHLLRLEGGPGPDLRALAAGTILLAVAIEGS